MKNKYLKIIEEIREWMQKIINESNTHGFVYGVSGGIDSALICAISSKYFKNNSLALRMDINNSDKDRNDAKLVIEHFNVKSETVDLEKVYDVFSSVLPSGNKLGLMNLKSRIRMNTLYYYAQKYNYLVCGTSNAAELYTGYFTKYGDSGSDFMPLANLTKHDVYECAKLLNVPQSVIDKAPSAGLDDNQTDEKDLQVTYLEIDKVLQNENVNPKAKQRIEYLHKTSEHKRNLSKTMKKIGELL